MQKKRFIAYLITLCMLTCLWPAGAFAEWSAPDYGAYSSTTVSEETLISNNTIVMNNGDYAFYVIGSGMSSTKTNVTLQVSLYGVDISHYVQIGEYDSENDLWEVTIDKAYPYSSIELLVSWDSTQHYFLPLEVINNNPKLEIRNVDVGDDGSSYMPGSMNLVGGSKLVLRKGDVYLLALMNGESLVTEVPEVSDNISFEKISDGIYEITAKDWGYGSITCTSGDLSVTMSIYVILPNAGAYYSPTAAYDSYIIKQEFTITDSENSFYIVVDKEYEPDMKFASAPEDPDPYFSQFVTIDEVIEGEAYKITLDDNIPNGCHLFLNCMLELNGNTFDDATTVTVRNPYVFVIEGEWPENGSVSCTVDGIATRWAAAGKTVTIVAEPDSGYELDTFVVTDANGDDVSVSGNTFVMPATSVTVTISFKEASVVPDTPVTPGNGGSGEPGSGQGSGTVTPGTADSGSSASDSDTPTADTSTGAAVDAPASEVFTDVAAGAWYEPAVSYVVEKDYFKGVTETEFAPDKDMSRAMFATVLWRIAGEPKAESETSFSDVADGRYFTAPVAWAAEEGLLFGSGGLFDPDGDITREQIVTVLYRYIKSQGGGFKGLWSFPLNFTDAGEVSDWAYEAMCWMTMNGVIDGKGEGRLDPKGSARRSEVAQIVMRFDELLKNQ